MVNSSSPDYPTDSNSAGGYAAGKANLKTVGKGRRSRAVSGINIVEERVPVDSLLLRFRQNLHTFFSTLFSFLIHVILLIALGFYIHSQHDNQTTGITAEITSIPDTVLPEPNKQELTIEIAPAEYQAVLEEKVTEDALAENMPMPSIALTEEQESAPNLAPIEYSLPLAPNQFVPVHGGLEGRSSSSRSALASKYGGTVRSELAVENGLKWLANHQQTDGSWRLDFSSGPCNGRCNNPATRESTTAATGLTLMAFLGAGYTHESGPYQQHVQNGLDYLKSRMRKTQFGGNLAEGTMYAQGIATIALSEAYSMTGDKDLREAVQSAMQYIVTAQHEKGGWRYTPGEPGDTTVTGWQLMALKSCEMAELRPPVETLKKARKFLSSVGEDSSGYFGYQNKERDPTSTAVGLLLQMYLGWDREHRGLIEGTRYLSDLGPSENNIYFNYYATLALFQSRHENWETWNAQLREYLVQTQSTTGHESGSWFFKEQYGTVGGRLYTTAMAVMILEVYYRYLPLFDRDMVSAKR